MDAENVSLRKEIDHPAHRHSGPLTLYLSRGSRESSCSICGEHLKERDPVYSCSDPDCDFKVDVACSSISSVIEFEAHRQHPLCFVERPAPGTSCRRCQDERSDLPMFRCGECGFSLHLLCGPLPCVLQYRFNELTLTDSLIPGDGNRLHGAGPGDCVCDICEEPRDAAECVYHSPDTEFTVSINCLLPQIILALKGELGDVELRTVGEHIPGKVIGRAQVEDSVQPTGADNEIYGDEVAQEAECPSQTCSDQAVEEEAESSSPTCSDQEVEEEAESSTEMEDAFGSFFLELGKFLDPVLTMFSEQLSDGEVKFHGAEWEEEAETSTAMEAIRGLSLDSHQLLRSLNADPADYLEGFLNEIAKSLGKSKATGSFPLLDDAVQRFKEQLDISCLEEDVQLQTEEPESTTLTYVQLMRSFTPRDLELINSAFERCTKHGEGEEATVSFLYYSYPPPPRETEFSYSDEAFEQFKEQIDNTNRVNDSYLTGWKKYAAKIVKVGNNMIPSQFVTIYRELVDKYGDFGASCELSPTGKVIIFHLFFAVIYSMRGTQVCEITDDHLCTWQYYLRGVQNAGFQIQFALDNLEKLRRAHFGVKVTKFQKDTTEDLETQVKEISGQIDDKQVTLEMLKTIQEKYKKAEDAEETLVKQCLMEAAKWKWKDVGELIL